MDIRFISSLTAEDEDVFAPAVLKAVTALLDQLPIAYTIRIETTRAKVYQHTHAVAEASTGESPQTAISRAAAPAALGPPGFVDGAFLKFFSHD